MSSNRKMTIEEKYEDCCIALNSITKEFEAYKKALDLACKRIALDDDWDWQEWRKYILDKVRGEE